jgi:hypothetical protein
MDEGATAGEGQQGPPTARCQYALHACMDAVVAGLSGELGVGVGVGGVGTSFSTGEGCRGKLTCAYVR